ncbi:YbaK/EbsC family protein [Streptomyces sp. NPDC014734]|uniref:YbaK/EbsC family protein n=1 Tax=Streptomyces sp. NPDC014734 TaxID=3364886 RepID=UPI0036FB546C
MPHLTEHTTSERLLRLLTEGGARFTLLEHPPEGQTARASALRGHPLSAAAKCMVVTVTGGPSDGERHVLTVIPGDRRVDFAQVAREAGGTEARLARREVAEALTGCVSGSIIPFSFHDRLPVLADPALFDEPTLYFNAARLDLSVALASEDYRPLADPKVVPVAERPQPAAAF